MAKTTKSAESKESSAKTSRKTAKSPTKSAKKAAPSAKKAAKAPKPAKETRGRKRKVWSEVQKHQFEQLCGILATRKETAAILGIDVRTLDKNIAETYPETPTWEEAFERFSSTARVSLRRKQYEAAMSGNTTMLIWLGKNLLGQSDDPSKKKEGARRESKLLAFQGKRLSKASGT